MSNLQTPYLLGASDCEHERLTRQAALIEPFTERLFGDAGIGTGQRVLDIGSGVGDVAMLVARLVGPTGEVVGVERDAGTIAKATARVTAAGLRNVTFLRADLGDFAGGQRFDAAVGRFILQFLPDPVAVVRAVANNVRPGGVLAFHESAWAPFLRVIAHLPLASACASLMQEAFHRSGARTDMGLRLYATFREAGLPPPQLRMELPLGDGPEFTLWIHELWCTLLPQMAPRDLTHSSIGDLDTLADRLQAEVAAEKTFGAFVGMVGAWSRRP